MPTPQYLSIDVADATNNNDNDELIIVGKSLEGLD
jgi:hypothetical protein